MPKKIYAAPETPITFTDSGGDVVLTLQNLGSGAGRISARYDRGAGSKPRLYIWKGIFRNETTPAAGDVVAEIWIAESDGTYVDGTVGTLDAAMASDARKNLKLAGTVIATSAAANVDFIASGLVTILDRYVSVGAWNPSASHNLRNVATVNRVILTAVPDELQ